MLHDIRHTCLIYSGDPSEQIPTIASAIINQLNRGYRCLSVNRPEMIDALCAYLRAAGLDLNEQIRRGALVLSSAQAHLVEGCFEIDPLIGTLRNAANRSVSDGFKGLWASGDMTWELAGETNPLKLYKYECQLEELFHEIPTLIGTCQYHMDTLSGSLVQNALFTHRAIYINETLAKINPNYLPLFKPAEEPSEPTLSVLDRMLERLGLPLFPRKAGILTE